MTPRNKITTAAALRRREAQARAIQAAVGPGSEIARLQAQVNGLLAVIRQRELTIAGLERQISEIHDDTDD
jgi:hypothetical protein